MKSLLKILPLLLIVGCAGQQRSCASGIATTFGGDWVIVQYKADGNPMNCWMLKNTSVSNEQGTDGIYWLDNTSGHLVHISGWYNRIQVTNNDYHGAALLTGVEFDRCRQGTYYTGELAHK